jgi:polyribonucleotide nucleotidyltransferase
VKVTESLTLSEANLREELMNVINSNTEEMNAMICSHNDMMKTTEEKLFQLEIQNKELKDKISQKSESVKKEKKGIKNSIKVISDDEDSEIEIEDEDTIDVNKTQYGFMTNDLNVSRKSEGRANTVRLILFSSLLCSALYA